jgi:hypothetical protein
MTKVRAIQRYKLPNFDLINGNGIVERIQLLVDPVEIADYQDPVEIADYQDPVESKKSPGIHKSVRISALQAAQKLRWIFKNGR